MYSRPYLDVVLADNPMIYWRLGETAGQLAYDESVNHMDASYIGNPFLGLRGAIVGDQDTAMGFDGVGQYAQWNPPISLTGTFTVEAWVKESKIRPFQTFFSTRTRAADFSFDFMFDLSTTDIVAKEIRFEVGNGRHWLAVSRMALNIKRNVWYHIAAVVTPTGAHYYVDGLEIGSASYSGTPLLFDTAHPVQLGDHSESGVILREVVSVIDEVAIYDYALSSDQIATHYLTGNPPGE